MSEQVARWLERRLQRARSELAGLTVSRDEQQAYVDELTEAIDAKQFEVDNIRADLERVRAESKDE